MVVLEHMRNNSKLEHLQVFFPKLTESNQQYVLGLVEGLKHAQGKEPPAVQKPNCSSETIPRSKNRSLEHKTSI